MFFFLGGGGPWGEFVKDLFVVAGLLMHPQLPVCICVNDFVSVRELKSPRSAWQSSLKLSTEASRHKWNLRIANAHFLLLWLPQDDDLLWNWGCNNLKPKLKSCWKKLFISCQGKSSRHKAIRYWFNTAQGQWSVRLFSSYWHNAYSVQSPLDYLGKVCTHICIDEC